jgi:hypothetical protein
MQGKNILIYLMLLAPATFTLTSCGGGEKKESTEATDVEDTDDEVIEEDSEESSSILPSPIQVAEIFNKAGLTFDFSVCNAVENADKYTTDFKQKVNYGVYSADLAYAIVSNKTKEATEIMKVVNQMSGDVGLGSVTGSKELMTRFEKNINNKDSIFEIMFVIQQQTDDYLYENKEQALGMLIFAGAWVEGMYFGAKDAIDKKKTNIGGKLTEQMIVLESLLSGLRKSKDKSPDLEEFITDLGGIFDSFKNMESVKGLEGDEAYAANLTPDEVKIMAEKLIALRTKITNI